MPGDSILVIETSAPEASLALVGPEGTLRERSFTSDRNHNAALFAPLDDLLADGARISLVLVGSGPGSYSGTRVGIAAAQGVAIAHSCPAIAVPSLLALPAADLGASFLAVGDARRGSFWTARVDQHCLTQPPTLCDLAALTERIRTSSVPVITVESSTRYPADASITRHYPDATRLWRAWQAASEETRAAWAAAAPQPIYLKPPHITPAKKSQIANHQ